MRWHCLRSNTLGIKKMSKYICICGMKFKKKTIADNHAEHQDKIDGDWRHIIFKSHWQVRLLDWVLAQNWKRFFKLTGSYIVLLVLEHHFQINFSIWEAALLGLGMGLYID